MSNLKEFLVYAPDTLAQLIRDEKVTFSHCVHTLLHMLLTSPTAKDVDLAGWKVIIGGSAFPKGLAAAALARGVDAFAGYGMSETCPILPLAQVPSDFPADDQDVQADQRVKTGYPIPLVDIHTVALATMGYLHNPAASADLWAGGYLHTGDIGVINPAGCLQVTDRLKDVIKTGGKWVSSLDLESIISQHPAVSEAAVIGIKDDKWGERPMALVVLKDGQNATTEDIKGRVQKFADEGHISRYAIPDQVRFVTSLPRTSVGKLNKMVMRQQVAA